MSRPASLTANRERPADGDLSSDDDSVKFLLKAAAEPGEPLVQSSSCRWAPV